jgi:hypothetical protein
VPMQLQQSYWLSTRRQTCCERALHKGEG